MTRSLLAIETSCDETAAAVVDDSFSVRASVVASQIDLHAAFGGVVPELASRAHLETVTPIVERALHEAGLKGDDLTAVAVTSGPGLVGALLVGIATAKALALGWGIPVVGVNHLEGHLASVYLADHEVPFPQIALLVSGGHCMLTRSTEPGRYELLGETVDDSIGEAYDKVARFLGLGYPGGPVLDRLAATGKDVLGFPRPMLAEGYTFSFSGLKTAVVNYVRANPGVLGGRGGGLVRRRLHGRAHRQAPPSAARVRRPRSSPLSVVWRPAPFCGRGPRRCPTSSAPDCSSRPRHGHRQRRDDRRGGLAQTRRWPARARLRSVPSPTFGFASPRPDLVGGDGRPEG